MFAQLLRREEQFANQLIEDVVSKADGVFLWVALVVSSLLSGMAFGDRVSDLNRRLDVLPPDLGKLYEKMLLSLDPFYLEHAAQLFSLVRASTSPLPLLVASFADEDDLAFPLQCEIRPFTENEVFLRMDTMRRRINSRCKGLLEIKGPIIVYLGPPLGSPVAGADANFTAEEYFYLTTVQYLHRTVKDYIEGDHAQKVLQSAARSTYDPDLRLLGGSIAYLKGSGPFRGGNLRFIHKIFLDCLEHSRNVLPSSNPRMVLLLDELQKILSTLAPDDAASFMKHYSETLLEHTGFLEPSTQHSLITSDTFLFLSVQHGSVEYVRAKAETRCLIQLPTVNT
jgi:hypothetical protein